MRVSRLVACALLALAAPATAQELTGYAQSQYQMFDTRLPTLDGRAERQRIERWVQTLELRHMALPRNDLRVMSTFRITDLSYRDRPDQSRAPQGTLQVSHPWASMFAAYRPTTVTGGLGPSGTAAVGDSGRARTLTSRTQETVVSGQLAPPAWPRLDLAWTRRHRDRDEISAEEVGVTRIARMSWTRDALDLHGSLGDQTSRRDGATAASSQRTASAGAALHLVPRAAANVDLSYDVNDARIGDPLRTSGSSRNHNAAFHAGWRPDALSTWTGNWLWRRTESRGARRAITEDHEGALQLALDPPGPLRFFGGAGARTLRLAEGRVFTENVSAVATLDGRVRTGWTGVASLTHVTTWQPGRSAWSAEVVRVGSQMTPWRGLELAADARASTSDDSTLRDVRASTEADARARLSPWPAFTAGWTGRATRSGPGFARSGGATARTSAWDLRWRPFSGLELTGTRATTRTAAGARTQVQTAGARWAVHPRLQVVTDWSRSSDERTSSGLASVNGREIATARVLALLSRKVQLDAAAGIADRGGPRESRQGTVTVTWAFGR